MQYIVYIDKNNIYNIRIILWMNCGKKAFWAIFFYPQFNDKNIDKKSPSNHIYNFVYVLS